VPGDELLDEGRFADACLTADHDGPPLPRTHLIQQLIERQQEWVALE
jgi:hypothetical protein